MLSRLPLDEERSILESNTLTLQFDENISDICVLAQIPIKNIIVSEQHADEFCKPIFEYLHHNLLPIEPQQIAQIFFYSKYMVVDNDILGKSSMVTA